MGLVGIEMDEWKTKIQLAANSVLPCLCQLVLKESSTKVKPFGSGILLLIGEQVYLISACHVLKSIEGLHIPGETLIYQVAGQRIMKECADIAAVQLTPYIAQNILNRYTPLALSDMELDHRPIHVKQPQYAAVGFPASMVKSNPLRKETKGTSLTLLTSMADEGLYPAVGRDPDVFLLSTYHRGQVKYMDNIAIQQGPQPHGSSGGGLWYLKAEMINGVVEFRPLLIGILIEHLAEQGVMVSTRIDVITDILRHLLEPSIPESPLGIRVRGRRVSRG